MGRRALAREARREAEGSLSEQLDESSLTLLVVCGRIRLELGTGHVVELQEVTADGIAAARNLAHAGLVRYEVSDSASGALKIGVTDAGFDLYLSPELEILRRELERDLP